MSDVRYMQITAEEAGQRLDNYLLRVLKGVPKSHIYRIIRGGEVRVNSKRSQVSLRLAEGDSVRIPPIRVAQDKVVSVSSEFGAHLDACVLFEDDALMVINKPAGLAVHGGSGLNLGLIEALRKHRSDLPYLELVHRLDKETSGCLLVAKKRSMLRALQALLEARSLRKTYWTLWTNPWVGASQVTVNVALQKNTLSSGERRVIVHPEGKASETRFKLLENYTNTCLVEATPRTGRTHQIRVHSAYLKHPIVGDEKYTLRREQEDLQLGFQRLYLHAFAVDFELNGRHYHFQAPIDDGFKSTLKKMKTEA